MSKSKSIAHRPASKTSSKSENPVLQAKENERKPDLAQSNNFLSQNSPADANGNKPSPNATSLARSNDGSTAGSNQVALRTLKTTRIQAKLKTDSPGDSLEQEADLVSDQILQMADPQDGPPNKTTQSS